MKNVTYIVPIHVFNKEVEKLLKTAIKSVGDMVENDGNLLTFVGPKTVIEKAKKAYDATKVTIPLTLIENDDTDFFAQVNKAVFQCTTYYFSILEFDDAYEPYWNKEANVYGEGYSIVIPINEILKDGNFVAFANEIAWNPSFAGEVLGELTFDDVKSSLDFNLTGAYIKTEDFISVGGLKTSLKFAAWYEFLLRATHNGQKIFVAPKLGYRHTINREGSFMEATRSISKEEGEWLIKTATQEYFFKEDRHKVFGEAEPEEK